MKELFLNKPLFRILSPLFSGIIVYLLILMIHNNVDELQEYFLGVELLLCIVLSYLIQELSRAFLILYHYIPTFISPILSLVIKILIPILLCILTVSIFITLYFKYMLGFTVNSEELWIFNVIFCCFTLIYVSLYFSYQYLYKINSQKLESELLLKESLNHEFIQFKKEIIPELLNESLESLIVLIHQNSEKSEKLIDHLASIYRYILSGKSKQLVNIIEELKILTDLTQIFEHLPYRKLVIRNNLNGSFLLVPGSLIYIVQQIIKTTIASNPIEMELKLSENKDFMILEYEASDRISGSLNTDQMIDLEGVYAVYSSHKIYISNNNDFRSIYIPKLQTKNDT